MKKSILAFLTLTLALSSWAGASGPRKALAAAVEKACGLGKVPCAAKSLERIPITADVAQYRFEIQVGFGEHEKIRLHRIVKETAPYAPAHTSQGILMAHGDLYGFETTYLSSLATEAVPDDRSLPVFLAENDVDVWGLDFRWALVPEEEEDLSFMSDWDLETDAGDLGVALIVARGLRFATGSGFGKRPLRGRHRAGALRRRWRRLRRVRRLQYDGPRLDRRFEPRRQSERRSRHRHRPPGALHRGQRGEPLLAACPGLDSGSPVDLCPCRAGCARSAQTALRLVG